MECTKNDWKLFRGKVAEWQERYMDKLNKEYTAILSGEENASEKFWKLEERIRKDKKHLGVIIEMNKQDMLFNIVALLREDVITMNDLEGFSDDLKEKVNLLLQRY